VTVRVATRGSALARAQAEMSIAAMGLTDVEIVVVKTTGDRKPEDSVDELSGQGWFTGDVELALTEGRADIAVHSAKDLPLKLGDGLVMAAYLPRADCRDAFVSKDGATLDDLTPWSRVGTSSARRNAWIGEMRPDLECVAIRGNVDTRLAKLDRGDVDALVLAVAGLDRLGLGDRVTQRLDATQFVPSPAQGAIAIQTSETGDARQIVSAVDDPDTRVAVDAERAVLEGLGGGCLMPLGAHASVVGDEIRLVAALQIGGRIKRVEVSGNVDDARQLGLAAAAKLQ
jgi:hydroxymethylbilane synthase